MVSGKPKNHAVSFAARYADPIGGYLSAHSAWIRLRELVTDAEKLSTYFEEVDPPNARRVPWYGAEIVAYYAVGFVTCLEWHARSRLVDVLSFNPRAARADDVKPLQGSVVVDMISENVTVAGMIGANTNVSSFEAYMAIFDRVFSGAGIPQGSFDNAKKNSSDDTENAISGDEIESLKDLFAFRNKLVHEISIDTLGNPMVRITWSPDTAIEMGRIVLKLVQKLETALSVGAPRQFPNLLNNDGSPVSRSAILLAEIVELESRIEEIAEAVVGAEAKTDSSWIAARKAAIEYLMAEETFLRTASVFHYRWEDLREPLRISAVQSRHDYLSKVVRVLESVWDVESGREVGA